MNLARVEGEPTGVLYSVNFNQDCTSLLVGTKNGFTLYSLATVDKLEPIYYCAGEDVCIVERLFSSSLLAVVNLSSPRKLKVCHFKKGTEICNYSYPNSILSIRLNRMRLIVCLEDSLYIHNIKDMKVIHMIKDTPKNQNGLCALSPNSDNSYLAYPGSCQNGEIQIFDTLNLRAVTMISAHQSPCVAFAFNVSGTKLSSASEKGTVIRVYSVPDGQRLFVFRRGVKRCVSINSLAFSHDSMLLCASSNTETVHIFKLEEQEEATQEEPAGWMGYFGRALMSSTNYLPSQVADVFTQGRSFATVRLPNPGLRNICALSIINKTLRLLVACADGYLYIYDVPSNEQGGNCNLVKQHRLIGKDEMEEALESKNTSTSEADAIQSDGVKPISKEGSPPTESAPSSVGQVDSEDSKGLSDIAAATGELKLSESPNKVDDSEAVAD